VQPLVLFITPPPHDKLHVDQAVQSDKPPSTDKQGKTHDMKLYKLIKIEYNDNLIFLMIFGEVYSIQHYVIKLSVTSDRSVEFSRYSGFLHQ
jgi:hypothetical protein